MTNFDEGSNSTETLSGNGYNGNNTSRGEGFCESINTKLMLASLGVSVDLWHNQRISTWTVSSNSGGARLSKSLSKLFKLDRSCLKAPFSEQIGLSKGDVQCTF